MGVTVLLARPSFLDWKYAYRRDSRAGLADTSADPMKCRSSEHQQKHPWVPIDGIQGTSLPPSPTPCSSSHGQWYPPAVRRDATGHVLVMGIPPKDACVHFTGLANVPDFHWFLSFWWVSVTWNTRVPLPSPVSVPYALRLWAISTGSEMASAVSGFHWWETPLAH